MVPVNIFELEAIARENLSREAYDYYASGAQDEVTLRENRAAYDRLTLDYRVLVDVSRREMATTVLGQPVAMPLLVAPTAFHRLATPEGEVATARAAAEVGVPHILSTASSHTMEEVGEAAGDGPRWYQLYWPTDDELAAAWIRAPLCLLADEPFAGIDPADAEVVAEAFRGMARQGCAIVITGHEVRQLLDSADDIVWMTSGTTHHMGTPEKAVQHEQFRREYLGPVRLR